MKATFAAALSFALSPRCQWRPPPPRKPASPCPSRARRLSCGAIGLVQSHLVGFLYYETARTGRRHDTVDRRERGVLFNTEVKDGKLISSGRSHVAASFGDRRSVG
jgi:hypothetical protein